MNFKGNEVFCEDPAVGNVYRNDYMAGIHAFIQKNNREGAHRRTAFIPPHKLVENSERFRQEFLEMLGMHRIPKGTVPAPTMQYVSEDAFCKIYRVQVYITEEIPFYGMLLLPHGEGEHPLVVCQHGGTGTPELLAGFNGHNNYGFVAQRFLEKGAAVVLPQLMLWNLEEIPTARDYKVPYDRKQCDTDLRRFGITLTGLEIRGIMKLIDFATAQPTVSATEIGMAGLSYGGYFTLYTMAADTRIKAGFSAGCFNNRGGYAWRDTTYLCSGNTFEDAEVAALCAPRPLYVAVGTEDQVFDYRTAIPETERAKAYFEAYGCPENFVFELWEGGHHFPESDAGFAFTMNAIRGKS